MLLLFFLLLNSFQSLNSNVKHRQNVTNRSAISILENWTGHLKTRPLSRKLSLCSSFPTPYDVLNRKKTRRRRIENSEIHQANGVRSHVTSIHLNQWMNMWPLSFSSSISARSWQRAGNAGRVNDADYLSSRLPFGRVRLMNTCTRYICPYSGNNLIYYSRSWPPSARGETKLNTKIEWLRERSVSACFTIQLS